MLNSHKYGQKANFQGYRIRMRKEFTYTYSQVIVWEGKTLEIHSINEIEARGFEIEIIAFVKNVS